MLIPEHLLQSRCIGVSKLFHVDDIIASIGDEAGHAFRPQSGCDAGRQATPVVAGQNSAVNAETIKKIDKVMTKRGLLPAAHRSCGQKAGGTKAAQIGYDDARSRPL